MEKYKWKAIFIPDGTIMEEDTLIIEKNPDSTLRVSWESVGFMWDTDEDFNQIKEDIEAQAINEYYRINGNKDEFGVDDNYKFIYKKEGE